MQEKIKQYFNQLFEDAPKTRKALELKQEMTQNALDKYEDMLQEGYSEEDAYQNVIQSIGDVTELFGELEEKNLLVLPEEDRKKRAMLKAVSIGLYIFAVIVFFFFATIGDVFWGNGAYMPDLTMLGLCLAALICIVPTIMLIYAANMYPNYTKKKEDNMVEVYKEERYLDNREKAICSSVSAIVWTLSLVLYFLISFLTFAWYITWVIFLMAACAQAIVLLVFSLRKEKSEGI